MNYSYQNILTPRRKYVYAYVFWIFPNDIFRSSLIPLSQIK